MLGYLRNNADSLFTKALLALIAVVFVFFFGSGALNSPRSEMLMEVNGEAIREQEVNQAWRRQVRFQQRFNPNMTEAQQLQIKRTVIDDLIERRLLLQAAAEEGITVSPKQLRRAVVEDPIFQDDQGNFDQKTYENYLGTTNSGRTKARLQSFYSDRALVAAVERMIRSGVQVSEPEIREAWEKENSTRNMEFIRVSTSLFRGELTPDDGELDAWMTDNGEAVKERYDRDFDRKYNQPKKVSARHILLKFSDEDGDDDRDSIRAMAGGILEEARAEGAEFADLAAKYSEDTSATRGGDLGFFDSKRMVKPFSDAAFSMEIGAISEVVETQYGVHIIKVEDITEAVIQPLEEVSRAIATDLYGEDKAPELAREFALGLVGVLDGSMDEEAAAALLETRRLEIQETGDFDGGARSVPKLGRAPEAVTAAFAMTEVGAVTMEPIEIPNGYVLMRLKEASDPDADAYEEDRDDVRDRLLRTRQTRALEAYKANLKDKATIRIAVGA